MLRTPTVPSTVLRVVAALAAALAFTLLGAGPAQADGTAPRVHHVFPENGAVLAAAPDHLEIMFDVELVPGQVDVGVAPDDTGRLVDLPAPPVLDGPVLVQPLPQLAAGHYTVGVRLLDADGRLTRGTFGFAVDPDPSAADAAAARPTPSGPPPWLVPAVAAALLLPAAGLALRRRVRRTDVRRPWPARDGASAGPGRAAGRTPTSASSPGARRDR